MSFLFLRNRLVWCLKFSEETLKKYGLLPRGNSEILLSQVQKDLGLKEAVLKGDKTETTRLLRRGANVHKEDLLGYTSIHHAILYGHYELIDLLVEYGADIENEEKLYGFKPLHLISQSCEKEKCLEKLLNYSVDIHSRDFMGNTLLICMVRRSPNSVQFIKKLLLLGLDPNAANVMGNNCLHILAESDLAEKPDVLASLFIRYRIDINRKNITGETPLHIASQRKKSELVEILLREGADINLVDTSGKTAFQKVYKKGAPSIYQSLLYEVFLKHIVLMVNRGELIHPILKKIVTTDTNLRRLYSYFRKELQCLKKMEVTKLFQITYYDILCQSEKQLAKYLKNVEFSNIFLHQHKYLNSIFSIEIKHRYEKVMKSVRIREHSFRVLNEIFHHRLPYECVEKIATYLSPNDLKEWSIHQEER